MLVCSVVMRAERVATAAGIIEAAEASDTPTIGIIFATITDAPGNARDILDAFTGSRLVEAASATDSVNVGSIRNAAIIEDTIAGAVAQFPFTYALMVAEIATAASTQDAALGTPRSAMVGTVFINSSGTARQVNADGIMVNL